MLPIDLTGAFGHYQLIRLLGRGGMADVYLAEDRRLGRQVALKILPELLARDADFIKRFEREVRATAQLEHRHIVPIYEFGSEGTHHYYSMRLLSGGDLKARIRSGMDPDAILQVLTALLAALDYAHQLGYVHRDIKPENILFDTDGEAHLSDFGIVRAFDANTRMTHTGMSLGTPRYMSPEQARGEPVDGRADLYSLGIVLYEMLTGRGPFEAEDSVALALAHVTSPPPPLPATLSAWQGLIDSLLAKDPAGRPTDANAMRGWLAMLAATYDSAPTRVLRPQAGSRKQAPRANVSTSEPASRRRITPFALLGLVTVFLLAGGATTWWLLPQVRQSMQNQDAQYNAEAPTATPPLRAGARLATPEPDSGPDPTTQRPESPAAAQAIAKPEPEPAPEPAPEPVPEPAPAPEPAVGYLQLSTNAPGTEVWIAGRRIGKLEPGKVLNLQQGLTPGSLQVQARAPGFQDQQQAALIRANVWTQLSLSLQPKPPDPPAPAPVQIPKAPAAKAGVDQDRARALARAEQIPPQLLQQALSDLGHYAGRVDGLIGPRSRTAIGAFQQEQGFPATGELSAEQIVLLIQQAAAGGAAESQNTLGMMSAEGIGVIADEAAARNWFASAAKQGNAFAAYNLALMYRDGRGGDFSKPQARRYLQQAQRGGYPQAAAALAELGD